MSEPLDYVIDDFLTGGRAHSDHHTEQTRHLRGRGRSAVPGRRATGDRSRGTRGADFGVVQDDSMARKQMNEYASYLDTKRRHDALVRGNKVENDVITFRNQETLSAYQNNRGIMVDYETKQYDCDRGVATSCSAVGRAVGDGRNPLARGNEGMIFGFTGGTGRTAPLEPRVAVGRRPLGVFDRPKVPSGGGGGGAGRGATQQEGEVSQLTPVGGGAVSGVDDVPAGGGMIQPRGRERERSPEERGDFSRSQARRAGEALRPSNPEPSPPPPPVDTGLPDGGVFQPRRQRPRVNNDGGGDRDGRDGTASQVGIPQFETLNTGVGIGGVVDAPLVSKGEMINTIMRFEDLRIKKDKVLCPKDNQLLIHHA